MKKLNELELSQMGDIVNLELIHNYQKINGSSIIEEANRLFSESPRKVEKRRAIQQLILENLNKICQLDKQDATLLFSKKKTENSIIIKKLIFKDFYAHQKIQTIRQRVMKSVRSQLPIGQDDRSVLRLTFYVFAIQFSQENFSNLLKLKKCLISLRKLLGCPNKNLQKINEIQKKERSQAYQMNLDFKWVLMRAADSIVNLQVKNQFKTFLSQAKNKRWIGCRFYKTLNGSFWTLKRVKIVYKAIYNLKIRPEQIQSDYDKFLDSFDRLKINIKRYTRKIKKKIIKDQQNVSIQESSSSKIKQQIVKDQQIYINDSLELKQIKEELKLPIQFSLFEELCQIDLSSINFINSI